MSLSAGDKLRPYQILALIGAGGMGEVYRARDAKLKRDISLKVLAELFARDPERMGRFRREAEVLASLNHPNIATIYGLEENALVMELVEGADLPRPLPIDAVLKCARQIAEALEVVKEEDTHGFHCKAASLRSADQQHKHHRSAAEAHHDQPTFHGFGWPDAWAQDRNEDEALKYLQQR